MVPLKPVDVVALGRVFASGKFDHVPALIEVVKPIPVLLCRQVGPALAQQLQIIGRHGAEHQLGFPGPGSIPLPDPAFLPGSSRSAQ